MAHNIDLSNGRENIAFAGATPWHGLGTQMPEGTDIDAWRKAAGLDFVVKTAPIEFMVASDCDQCPTVSRHPFAAKVATYREDTMGPLGIVSKHYKIVQPREVVDFFREFAAAGDMKIDVAGSILGGRRVWALARHEMEIKVKGADIVRPYFLLTTSFDGETATIGTFTTTRVVCNNTLNIAYQQVKADGTHGYAQAGFSIPHIQNFDANVAKSHVAKLVTAATQFEEVANRMADAPLVGEAAERFFVGLVGVKNAKGDDITRQSREKAEMLFSLYRSGPGSELNSAHQTVWGALNAVTRYVDFCAGERRPGGRLNSAWYGAGKELKAKTYQEALRLVSGDNLGSLLTQPIARVA